MRTIVKASLRFRWIVLFLAASILALGFIQLPDTKVVRLPRVRSAAGRDPNHCTRQLLKRGRGVDHGPYRGSAERY